MVKKLKVLDLFSGVGGFSLGLERAGMETVMFCEIEKEARKKLRKNWPNTPIWEDVKTLCKKYLKDKKIDVICGGFPCQDVSVAGKQKGFVNEETKEATRSGLWFEFKRLIQEIKPRYVIIENVANLRSEGLARVIKDLGKIGYMGEWHIISARSIGAPHLRERIFIIAYHDSSELRKQSERRSRKNGKGSIFTGNDGQDGNIKLPNANHLRLWKPFASEKEKQKWWAEATASVSHWAETKSIICGVDDGISTKLDRATKLGKKGERVRKRIRSIRAELEKVRKSRIEQLGNAILPQKAEIIGREILKYENE